MTDSFSYNDAAVATRFDALRDADGDHYDALAAFAARTGAKRVLDIGCGTGQSTAAFRKRHDCWIAGLDRSGTMLQRACAKTGAPLCRGDAQALPFRDGAFDVAFAVLVIHHLPDLGEAMRSIRRVVTRGVAVVTSPRAFIESHPLTAYFPSFSAIDLARFQSEDAVEKAMQEAGFGGVERVYTARPPQPIDAAYLKRIEGKFISTLDLVPPAEFAEGLERMRADIAANGGALPEPLVWEAVVIHAETA